MIKSSTDKCLLLVHDILPRDLMNLYKKTEVVKKYVCVLNHDAEVVRKSTLGCLLQVTDRSSML